MEVPSPSAGQHRALAQIVGAMADAPRIPLAQFKHAGPPLWKFALFGGVVFARDILISGNLTNAAIRSRNDGNAVVEGNVDHWFKDALAGDLHLDAVFPM